MKVFMVLIALYSAVAMGKDLNCQIDKTQKSYYMNKSFSITNIENEYPGITNFDGGNLATENPLTFSNECENWMEMSFPTASLTYIKKGEINEISGVVFYSHSEMESSYEGAMKSPYNEGEYMIAVRVTCKLAGK